MDVQEEGEQKEEIHTLWHHCCRFWTDAGVNVVVSADFNGVLELLDFYATVLLCCYSFSTLYRSIRSIKYSNISDKRNIRLGISIIYPRGFSNCRYYDAVSDNIFHFRVPEKVIFSLFFNVFRQLEDFIDLLSVRKFMITIAITYPRIIC